MRPLLLLLLPLAACGVAAPDAGPALDLPRPPPAALTLTAGPAAVGQDMVVLVDGAEPGGDVYLVGSLALLGPAWCPGPLPVCLDVPAPAQVLSRLRADAQGHAEVELPIPARMPWRRLTLQAIGGTPADPALSNATFVTLHDAPCAPLPALVEPFDVDTLGTDWEVVDETGQGAVWEIRDGALVHSSNTGAPFDRGTWVVSAAGLMGRGRITASVTPVDDDQYGLMVDVTSPGDWLRLDLDRADATARLVRSAGGVVSVLQSTAFSGTASRQDLVVEDDGHSLRFYAAGDLLFTTERAACGAGGIGLWARQMSELRVDTLTLEPAPTRCGDGDLDPGETCDDGNGLSGDGCSMACQVEPTPFRDADGDGLGDHAEVVVHGTDPRDPDTDGDGLDDRAELERESLPLDPTVDYPWCPGTTPLFDDFRRSDLGGWTAFDEGVDARGTRFSWGQVDLEGYVRASGSSLATGPTPADERGATLRRHDMGDGVISVRLRRDAAGDAGVIYGRRDADTAFRVAVDDTSAHLVQRDPDGDRVLGAAAVGLPRGVWATLTVAVSRGRHRVTLGDQLLFDVQVDGCALGALGLYVSGATDASFDDVRYQPVPTTCGDGVVDAGEVCDDGGVLPGDGCDPACHVEGCGDGVLAAGEACDDGGRALGDGCTPACTLEGCGDGFVSGAEGCDGGPDCSVDCQPLPLVDADLDGVHDALDRCPGGDDRADLDGDGWLDDCPRCTPWPERSAPWDGPADLRVDYSFGYNHMWAEGTTWNLFADGTGWSRDQPGTYYCADWYCGVTRPPWSAEYPFLIGDLSWRWACGTNTLTFTLGWRTITSTNFDGSGGTISIRSTSDPTVGHGWGLGGGTFTVAANPVPGAFCDAACVAAQCGNGVVQPGEACDDGGNVDQDGCSATCRVERCGDRVVQPLLGESCDDGNTVDGDGCSAACVDEGFCGDGRVSPALGEACDDGNTAIGDGCDAACQIELCGDGVLGAGETCDDGNRVAGDGCDVDCQQELCGNGLVQVGETCDDGNAEDGDHCSNACAWNLCGDGVVQPLLGEQCDDGLLWDSPTCGLSCRPGDWNRVAVGRSTSCGIDPARRLACWGALTLSAAANPGFLDVAVGDDHVCAIRESGELACWGSDAEGQATPPAGDDWIAVEALRWGTCAQRLDRTVTCWGLAGYAAVSVPVRSFHPELAASCVVGLDGAASCFQGALPGRWVTAVPFENLPHCFLDGEGALGCVGTDDGVVPPAGERWITLGSGTQHACGLRIDGTVWCDGSDSWGQLQAPPGPFVDLAAAGDTSCAVRTDGSFACWGRDTTGSATPP